MMPVVVVAVMRMLVVVHQNWMMQVVVSWNHQP
jgi:hypothetical protein